MSDNTLECPGPEGNPDWLTLYRTLGEDVVKTRPIFTGDVFAGIEVQSLGTTEKKDIIILQHPCALRINGVYLVPRLIVVQVRPSELLRQKEWSRQYRIMPLPELKRDTAKNHCAAIFTEPYLVGPEQLEITKRIACLSQIGVNLLLQRWVFHNSRSVVPTWLYQEVTSPEHEEADLVEEWCEERVTDARTIAEATEECHDWLRSPSSNGGRRQDLLKDPQTRSAVRKGLRDRLRELRQQTTLS
ncbi:MAG: hypothetical protein ACRDPW_07415 [Mycobacteriales bacterium]